MAGGVIPHGPKRPLFFFLFSFFFYISMAGEKPGAPANVLWGLFKFSLLCFFLSFYESVKVYTAVYKRVCIEMFLVMTDKTSSEMLRLYEALIRHSQY